MQKYKVTDRNGVELEMGATITDSRGDDCTYIGVSRGPQLGKSAKILVREIDTDIFDDREFYAKVFDITVVEKE